MVTIKKFKRLQTIILIAFVIGIVFTGCENKQEAKKEEDATPLLVLLSQNRSESDKNVVLEIGNSEMTWDEYAYIVFPYKTYFDNGNNSWWDENKQVEEPLFWTIENEIRREYALISKASELGIGLEKVQKEADALYYADIESAGGEEDFLKLLYDNHENEYVHYVRIVKSLIIQKLYDKVAEEPVYRVSEEEVQRYLMDEKPFSFKQIFLYTNEDGSDSEKKVKMAEELLARIRKGEDFDTLMKEYSEGSLEPYVLSSGIIAPDLERAILSLGDGEISEVVKSQSGVHLFLKLPYGEKEVLERMESQAFEEDISQRANEAIIRYMPEYQDISIKDIA